MTNHRIGDRPRFPLSNQRFDKGDAENIARYYEEIIARFTGSIYGQAWGCMSNPGFYMQSTVVGSQTFNYIKVSKCALLYSVPADNTLNTTAQDIGPWNAAIVQYDPARAGQPLQTLTTNTSFTSGQRPWILFRRQEAPTNTGNKAYWDTDNNTEEVGAAPLQDSEYVEFRLSTTYTPNDRAAGWYRCAYIDSWGSPASAATPVIVPVHWMDSQYYLDDLPPVQGTRVASALAHPQVPGSNNITGFNPQAEMPELTKLLHWVIGKLGQHYTATVQQVTAQSSSTYKLKPGAFVNLSDSEGWLNRPVRGMLEIESYLSELESTTLPLIQSQNTLLELQAKRTPRLLHTLYIKPSGDGSTEWPNYTFTVTSLTTTPSAPVTSTNSFSPTLVAYTGDPNAVSSSSLAYRVTAADQTGNHVLNIELVAGNSFVVSSMQVSLQADEAISLWAGVPPAILLKYSTSSPAALPPSSYVHGILRVVPDSSEFGILHRLVFVVNIYGRNV